MLLRVKEFVNNNGKAIVACVFTAICIPGTGYLIAHYLERKKIPEFTVLNAVTKPNVPLRIRAENSFANKNNRLDIVFDDVKFKGIGVPVEKDGQQEWIIDLAADSIIPKDMLQDGAHSVKFGFSEDNYSVETNIIFSSQAPYVATEIKSSGNNSKTAEIFGKASLPVRYEGDTIKVNVMFYDNGKSSIMNVPVTRVLDESKHTSYFEFETSIQDIPKYSESDSNYSKPFFGFQVVDEAGNEYYDIQSYAQFVAPGDKHFGVSNIGDVAFRNVSLDRKEGIYNTKFRITTNAAMRFLPNGKPAIELVVVSSIVNERKLRWKTNIENATPVSLIFRDDKQIGSAFADSFVDKTITDDKMVSYRIEKTDMDGKIFTSQDVKTIVNGINVNSKLPQDIDFFIDTFVRFINGPNHLSQDSVAKRLKNDSILIRGEYEYVSHLLDSTTGHPAKSW
jgi:hypothetical protein